MSLRGPGFAWEILVSSDAAGENGSGRFGNSGPVNRPAWAQKKFQGLSGPVLSLAAAVASA